MYLQMLESLKKLVPWLLNIDPSYTATWLVESYEPSYKYWLYHQVYIKVNNRGIYIESQSDITVNQLVPCITDYRYEYVHVS